MIIFSDLHLRPESEEVCLGKVLPSLLDEALALGDNQIVFLGDFWHVRYTVPIRLFNAVRDEFLRWTDEGIHLRLLPGNHDQINVEGRNALEAYGDIENVQVYNNPIWDGDGLWIPYRKNNEDIAAALSGQIPSNCPRIVFMHHGVSGALMNDHMVNKEGLPVSAFDAFDRIFTGHYHKRQMLGKVTYIGSPWQTKADESGQPKGFAQWDGCNLTFHDRIWGSRFHRFKLLPGEEPDLSDVRPGDDVRITTIGEGAQSRAERYGQMLAERDLKHSVTPEVEPMQQRLTVRDGADLRTYAQAYVEQSDAELDKARLLKAFDYLVA